MTKYVKSWAIESCHQVLEDRQEIIAYNICEDGYGISMANKSRKKASSWHQAFYLVSVYYPVFDFKSSRSWYLSVTLLILSLQM